MDAVLQPARALIDPIDGTGPAVASKRWFWPMLVLAVCVAGSGAAFAVRWNATPTVVQGLEKSGELSKTSEQDIASDSRTTQRTALVGGVAKGLILMPLCVLALALALKIAGWLFGTPATYAKCLSVAAIGMLPIALFHLLLALCVLRSPGLRESDLPTLLPANLGALVHASPKVTRVLSALDFFNLWSAVLLGTGFSAASGMRKGRGILMGLLLYACYAGIFLIGLPGLVGGPK